MSYKCPQLLNKELGGTNNIQNTAIAVKFYPRRSSPLLRKKAKKYAVADIFTRARGPARFVYLEDYNGSKQGRFSYFRLCVHPTQQHGRRMPLFIFESAFLMRIFLVSAFAPDVTQQIHSLRASGVISSHSDTTDFSDLMAFCRSAGNT